MDSQRAIALRAWANPRRAQVRGVRCRPAGRAWLIQVLDGQGLVMAEGTVMVSRMEQVRDLLAEDEVRLTGWRKSVAHGVEWLGDARMQSRF
jgi:hypothetical protein